MRARWRKWRAGWRDTVILLKEFRFPLILFATAVVGGGLLYAEIAVWVGEPVRSRSEAIFTGSSGGAAAFAARVLARTLPADALVITLFPDSGERYLSKLNEEWMAAKGLVG